MIQGSREQECLLKGDGIYFCPELHAELLFVQLYKKSNTTCNLQLFFHKDACMLEGKEWAVFYCQLCL